MILPIVMICHFFALQDYLIVIETILVLNIKILILKSIILFSIASHIVLCVVTDLSVHGAKSVMGLFYCSTNVWINLLQSLHLSSSSNQDIYLLK